VTSVGGGRESTSSTGARPSRTDTKALTAARRSLPREVEIDFAAEVVLSAHPYLSQMFNALTMGGPKPRTEEQLLWPSHGLAVVTPDRLLVLAYGRAVMDVPRSSARVQGTGGSAVMPWVDVRWGRRTVRTGFHWGRTRRDRFVELLGA
jgi:hypothetical protein